MKPSSPHQVIATLSQRMQIPYKESQSQDHKTSLIQIGSTQDHIELKLEREMGILTSLIKSTKDPRKTMPPDQAPQAEHALQKEKERDKQKVHKALVHTYMPRGGLGLSRPKLPTNINHKYQSKEKKLKGCISISSGLHAKGRPRHRRPDPPQIISKNVKQQK